MHGYKCANERHRSTEEMRDTQSAHTTSSRLYGSSSISSTAPQINLIVLVFSIYTYLCVTRFGCVFPAQCVDVAFLFCNPNRIHLHHQLFLHSQYFLSVILFLGVMNIICTISESSILESKIFFSIKHFKKLKHLRRECMHSPDKTRQCFMFNLSNVLFSLLRRK